MLNLSPSPSQEKMLTSEHLRARHVGGGGCFLDLLEGLWEARPTKLCFVQVAAFIRA